MKKRTRAEIVRRWEAYYKAITAEITPERAGFELRIKQRQTSYNVPRIAIGANRTGVSQFR